MKKNCRTLILTLLCLFLVSCISTDSKIERLDSLCDDYVEYLSKGRTHDAENVKNKMDKYWDQMNELNSGNKLSEQQKEKLDEIETRMFNAEFKFNY